jgi:26S proteasome regulatory subunit N1
MMSAAASLGLSLLWDTDVGLSHVDKYTYSSEEYIKVGSHILHHNPIYQHFQAGALLATGLLNTGVRTEADAAVALLGDYVENKSVPLKTSAIIGIGLAYAGSHREDLLPLLLPPIADEYSSMEIASLSALAVGFVFVGSGNGEVASTILQTLMEREESALEEKWGRFMVLGLGLLYLGL